MYVYLFVVTFYVKFDDMVRKQYLLPKLLTSYYNVYN